MYRIKLKEDSTFFKRTQENTIRSPSTQEWTVQVGLSIFEPIKPNKTKIKRWKKKQKHIQDIKQVSEQDKKMKNKSDNNLSLEENQGSRYRLM